MANITHQLVMGCPYGTIGELIEFGVNPSGSTSTSCISTTENSMCNPPSNSAIRNQFANIGNETTTVSIDVSKQNVFGNYAYPSNCTDFNAMVYVQFTCI